MKILLDECVPRKLKAHLYPHESATVGDLGLCGTRNGELLRSAAGKGFDVFLTLDHGLQYELNLTKYDIAVIVVRAKSSRLQDILRRVPEISQRLQSIRRGELVRIGE